MAIRIERDPEFWGAIAAHPAVRSVLHLDPSKIGEIVGRADIMPLASEWGGFLFVRMDSAGFACELHTLYHPNAWATREITIAAKQAFNAVFIAHYQVVTTLEVRANPHSQPPRSYGFVQAGDWRQTLVGEARAWVLTRAAWEASPVSRRARGQLN